MSYQDPTPTTTYDDDPPASAPRRLSHVRVAVEQTEQPRLADRRRQRKQSKQKKAGQAKAVQPAVVPLGLPIQIYVSARWLSLFIVVILLVVLYLFLTRDVFLINTIYVGGTQYLTSGEIFERTGLAPRSAAERKTHIFWVDSDAIEAQLELDPAIANAEVVIGWPPQMVQITITERQPALIWEQAGQRVWVDVAGYVMYQRTDLPDLVRVVVEKATEGLNFGPCPYQGTKEILGPGNCIDPITVAGALQFKALYPNVREIIYNPAKGLGYLQGSGWVLWFGDASDLALKMQIHQQIVDLVTKQLGRKLVEINVVDPDHPTYILAPR
jgi:hypothetical protein